MPTTVEVYQVESNGSTGSFLGFGSMLDPALVFLHPPPPRPRPDGPVEPGPIRPDGPIGPGRRPGPSRPGPYRPAFPTRPIVAQPLHDEVVQAPAAPVRPTGRRARCRIRSGISVLTLDGDVLPAPREVESPTAIQLDFEFQGGVDSVQVPQDPGHPTAEEAADAVLSFVTEAALSDPAEPTDPPPAGPDVGGDRPQPGRRPWYCVICPGAFGC